MTTLFYFDTHWQLYSSLYWILEVHISVTHGSLTKVINVILIVTIWSREASIDYILDKKHSKKRTVILLPLSRIGVWTTTCMVVTPPGISHKGLLHSPSVLLFSSIFPALINFTSFTVLGPFCFSVQQNCIDGFNSPRYHSADF